MKDLADVYFPDAEAIRVILETINTYTYTALCVIFVPEKVRRGSRKLEFHCPPTFGSLQNISETELSVVESQCPDRYSADIRTLAVELVAWEAPRNEQEITVDWQFTT